MPLSIIIGKATDEQKSEYLKTNPVYPLYGYVRISTGQLLEVEDLRGSWSLPDPIYEIRCPDGFHDDSTQLHGMLCYSLKDIKDEAACIRLVPCHDGCGGLPA